MGPDGEKEDQKVEGDVLELADFFTVPNRPTAFRVLPCIGLFRDQNYNRFGFVYKPPKHIENIDGRRQLSARAAELRKPQSLLDMIDEEKILPLGDRFQLARDLAQCLYVLHATGWVHKKYVKSCLSSIRSSVLTLLTLCSVRSSSVVFIPAESRYGSVPSTTGVKAVGSPFLCGFGYSRPIDKPRNYSRRKDEEPSGYRWTFNATNVNLDIYHHPAKRKDYGTQYIQAFDLYS